MGYVYLKPGRSVYMMQYFKNGRRVRESTGKDNEQEALKVLHATETDLDRGLPVGDGVGKLTFDEGVEMMYADYETNDRRSLRTLEQRIRLHLAPYFSGAKMTDITTPAIDAYVKARRDEGAGRGTINRELTALKRMFTLAVQRRLLLYKPHIPMLNEKRLVRTGFFEREQFESVRRRLSAALQPVVTFAYITGWRIASEVLPLEWRHVDFDGGVVRLDPQMAKNEDGRVFPMTDELRQLLEARAAAREAAAKSGHVCPFVFFRLVSKRGGRAPKVPKPILRFDKAWAAACQAAGVPGRLRHDFRRTAIRNAVRRGVPERVAMEYCGHKTRSVFERYNIVSPGDLAMAKGRLDGLVSAAPGGCDSHPDSHPGAIRSLSRRKSVQNS